MNDSRTDFVNIIRKAIDKPYRLSDEVDWKSVWEMAKRHHLEVLVYIASKDMMPSDIKDEAYKTCVFMQRLAVLQDYSIQQIESKLSDEGIPYAILKGAVIRTDYPDFSSRFMSDVDFCIRPEDRPLIRKAMEEIGGAFKGTESGDEQFIINKIVNVEFHGRLLYRYSKNSMVNYPDWAFVKEDVNRLTEEGFALNTIGHAVGDLLSGGPGIRYILDLWILKNRHKPQPDWDFINDRLRRDGILKAANNLMDLSEYLFGEGAETPLMEEMAKYVLKGGLHGEYKRGLISESREGKLKAVFKQLFRNRTEFENRYPWLKKRPYLLPFAWLLRLGSSLKRNSKTINDWGKNIGGVTKQEIKEQKSTLKRFGL